MAKRNGARRWFDWHSWIGIFGGLLLFIICWGGSFAVLSEEIDWLLTPAMRVAPAGEPAALADIAEVAQAAFPKAKLIAVLRPSYRTFAAVAVMATERRETRLVFVDPYRLTVTGDVPALNVGRFFRSFHEDFFGLLGAGKYLVCLFALPLILSLATALVFYKRWWRRFLELKIGKGTRAFWSSAHKVAGLWSLWFVALIALTGFWYLYEHARFHLVDGKFAYVDSYPLAVHALPPLKVGTQPVLSFRALLDRAQQARPDLAIRIVYPDRNGYFYVEGQAGDVLVRDRANKIFLDPRDGTVLHSQRASDLSPYWRWSDMADPLHFGNFAGLPSKILWFTFGLALSGLCLTGAWLHVKRLQRDAHHAGWRGSVPATLISLVPPLLTGPSFWYALKFAGPVEDGQRVLAKLPLATSLFLSGWALLTLAILAGWVWFLQQASRQSKTGAALRPRRLADRATAIAGRSLE